MKVLKDLRAWASRIIVKEEKAAMLLINSIVAVRIGAAGSINLDDTESGLIFPLVEGGDPSA